MAVYLDAIWLLNFIFDWLILLLTKGILKDRTKNYRVVFGAFIASLIIPLQMLFSISLLMNPVGKGLYSILIILCSFQIKTLKRFFTLLLYFYFISFAIGGGLFALYYFLNESFAFLASVSRGYGDPVSWLFIVIGFPIVLFFTKGRMEKYAVEKIRYDQYCEVQITVQGKIITTTGYIDSGNQLVDPVTKLPVTICDQTVLKSWFSDHDLNRLEVACRELAFEKIPEVWQSFIRIIPYRGVDGKNNFLLAIKPDAMIFVYDGQVISTRKVLIGMQFSMMTHDQSYHCLLHPQLIKLFSKNIA
ncbi:sigma-E processing peptidase SpoIIGA [Ornithinibacillus sp. 4-3]|uniref:Sporulation sigma-E factor-processing peptidase n=1 Tax=Ornithinibacillus sp. 4-3 TaxID=3231488 RepID=A0AB39HPD7_9BACI